MTLMINKCDLCELNSVFFSLYLLHPQKISIREESVHMILITRLEI